MADEQKEESLAVDAVNEKVSIMQRLNDLQDGRLISDIPLSDPYWAYKKEVDHLL